jgi:MFS transporter, DHA2 family, lincomycin resistance protein
VRSAFLCGGIISLLAVVGSFGVRRPAGTAGTESAAGAED